jgi:addiction module HigA family antidote
MVNYDQRRKIMAMKNPVHPGVIVREDCMRPLNLSVTECAKMLGIARQTLSSLVNEKVSVSIEMAYRLSKAFGSTPRTWLGMQLAFDLAQSQDLEQKIKVNRISMERQSR